MSIRRYLVALLVLCLVVTVCPELAAAGPPSPHASPSSVAAADEPIWRMGGFAAAVAVQDGVTYLLQGMKLLIIDLPTQTVLGELTFEYRPVDLVVEGDYAYVACDGYAALHIIDVSTPSSPTRVGGDRLSTGTWALALKYPYLYLFGHYSNEMLVVYDVSDPAAPVEKKSMNLTKYVNRVVPGTDHLYVLSTLGYVGAIDVSTPTAPVEEAGWLNAYAAGGDLVVDESTLYVAGTVGFSPGVRVVSALDPGNLSEVGSWFYTQGGDFLGLAVKDQYLYAGFNSNGGSSGLFVLNVASPSAITRVGQLWQRQGFYRFALDGTTLTGAAGDDGDVAAYSLANPTAPQVTVVMEAPGVAEKVSLVGTYAYVLVSGDHSGPVNGVYIYDLTDPFAPVLVSWDDGIMRIADFAVAGGYLTLCHSGGLSVRGETDLWDVVGNYTMSSGYCTAVAAVGTTAYMLGAPDDLVPVDIGDPTAPVPADGVELVGSPQAALIRDGTRLYAVEAAVGFNTVSIGSPLAPSELGRSALSTINALAVDGTVAYAGTANGLKILDVTSPSAVTPITSVATLNAVGGVDVIDDTVYVAGGNFLCVLDVSVPASPVEIWASQGTEPGRDIAGAGLWAVVAGGEAGLRLHMLADGVIKPSGGDTATVLPDEALVVTFAVPMAESSVTYSCAPDPGGWQATWTTRAALNASQELTLRHNSFTAGQSYTFTITGGESAEGDAIDAFSTTFTVIEGEYVYLPLVVRSAR